MSEGLARAGVRDEDCLGLSPGQGSVCHPAQALSVWEFWNTALTSPSVEICVHQQEISPGQHHRDGPSPRLRETITSQPTPFSFHSSPK